MVPDLQETVNIFLESGQFYEVPCTESRLFKKMSEQMGSTHIQLLSHTEVQRLSRGHVFLTFLNWKTM
jgi:hypothetical protein